MEYRIILAASVLRISATVVAPMIIISLRFVSAAPANVITVQNVLRWWSAVAVVVTKSFVWVVCLTIHVLVLFVGTPSVIHVAQRMHVGIVKRVGVKVVTFAIIANSAVKVAAWIALARRRRRE